MHRIKSAALAGVAGLLALAAAGVVRAAAKPVDLSLAPGARVGVINLLDPEVTQFHAARRMQDGFLKTYVVNWSVAAMLVDSLRERLTQLGLTTVVIETPQTLRRARESCLLDAELEKGLPKACGPLYGAVAAAEHVDALIVLGPGLNDAAHADGTRRRDLPQYLRGWCFVSEEGAAVPTLLNLSELLLIQPSSQGAQLAAREWGGKDPQPWAGFRAPPDLKDPPVTLLAELQPLYGLMLKQQTLGLLAHLRAAPH